MMTLRIPLESAATDYPNHLVSPDCRPARVRLRLGVLITLVMLALVPRALMALRIPSIDPDGVLYVQLAKSLEAGDLRSGLQHMALNVYPVSLMLLHRLGLEWELAAAVWGVAVSSLVVLPLWGWVRRQYDDRVALVACLLYVVHPKFIEWSPEVMRDQTFWFLFALTIYWMWRAVTEVSYGHFIAAGAALTAASLTRIEGLFLLVPLVLWTFWRWLALGPQSRVGQAQRSPTNRNENANRDENAWGGTRRHAHACRGHVAILPRFNMPTASVGMAPNLSTTETDEDENASGGTALRLSHPTQIVHCGIASPRWKLLLGAILCVVVFPLLLALVNAVWLYGHAGWTGIRLAPLARVQPWLEWVLGRGAAAASDSAPPLRLGRMIWVFIPTMTRGLSPVFALLMFGGMWGWRRLWARRDNQALFYTAVLVMCGIWVQLWYDKYVCPRYALPIVLMAAPLAALGMLGLLGRLQRIAAWLGWNARRQRALLVGAAAAVAVVGVADALTSNNKYFAMRQMAADMGRWVRREFADPPVLVGPAGIAPIASYYAQGSPYRAFRWDANDDVILAMVQQSQAGVVLLRPTNQLSDQRCDVLVERMKSFGMEPVDAAALPATHGDFHVLVRSNKSRHLARVPRSSN
jgi:hypothetical protein